MDKQKWRELLNEGKSIVEFTGEAPEKHYKVKGKKSTVEATYIEYGKPPTTIELEFRFKAKPNTKQILDDFDGQKNFYYHWLKKNFTERAFERELRSVRIPGFEIEFINFNTQFDENTINIKKKTGNKFSISVTIESKDKKRVFNIKEFKAISEIAVKMIEPELLQENEYLEFSAK